MPAVRKLLNPASILMLVLLLGLSALAWWRSIHEASGMSCVMMMPTMHDSMWVNLGLYISSWTLMMAAMMLPSIAPLLLVYMKAGRSEGLARVFVGTAFFVLGYLLVWAGSGVPAFLGTWLLEFLGKSFAGLRSWGPAFSAGAFLLAGVYQLSPLKNRCLSHCQSPLHFLMVHAKPGLRGAMQMGITHGCYCVICCWALMLVLFVLGIMNLLWMAIISVVMCLEKWLPQPVWLARITGAALIAAGVAVLVFPGVLAKLS
jgi:predicted metal-binding membrane protein